jgi:mercuric ion transport protein
MERVEKDFPGPPAISGEAKGAVHPTAKAGLVAAGGVLGALAASACCIVPLVLFALGISGAWIGNLTALAPYQPYSLATTAVFLGVGYYIVYRRPKAGCTEGEACARPLPNRIVKQGLWTATVLAGAAVVFPYVVPILLGA